MKQQLPCQLVDFIKIYCYILCVHYERIKSIYGTDFLISKKSFFSHAAFDFTLLQSINRKQLDNIRDEENINKHYSKNGLERKL